MDERGRKSPPFDSAVSRLCPKFQRILHGISPVEKRRISEIRLRAGRPVALTTPNGPLFLRLDGGLQPTPAGPLIIAEPEDLQESFRILCDYSVHSHQNEIRNGFLPLPGGHRAGLCGTAVYTGGELSGLRDISSINLRIAREINGAAAPLLQGLDFTACGGVLLAGPPSSGKTTILRDLAMQLATGTLHRPPLRVAVIDERGELAGTYQGINQNNIGICCDVLDGYTKAEGILQAIRGLSPQVIICDELGSVGDYESVRSGVNAGVRIIASVHAGNVREAAENRRVALLLKTGAFSHMAVLRGVGEIAGIYRVEDWYAQNHRADSDCPGGDRRGLHGIQKAI